ncbi:unnamed protein product [Rhizoctonia solani]|uniref:Uncharacterized protein n=1 Tax=Rhizoctonia solani TaxID=456999 RepID=A0A8H3ABV6_9AGAM|nr:unnamed protein product [Rhizoctonia solani]
MPSTPNQRTATVDGIPKATKDTQEFDEYGAELDQDARVWKTYMKEAERFDLEQVDGWNRSLDMTFSK